MVIMLNTLLRSMNTQILETLLIVGQNRILGSLCACSEMEMKSLLEDATTMKKLEEIERSCDRQTDLVGVKPRTRTA